MLKQILVVLCFVVVATHGVIQNPGFLMRDSGAHAQENQENVPVKFSVVPSQRNDASAMGGEQQNISESIVINPAHIELSVPGVPQEVGDKIIQQIRSQMGQEPISLGELNNRLVHFTSEVPATLINKTTVIEKDESLLVNKTVRMSPQGAMSHQHLDAPNYQQLNVPYVPQDYYYHPEPKVESKYVPQEYHQAPASYQAPYQAPKPVYDQQQQQPNCEPKVIYRYIEVCSNPEYRKAPTAPSAPKPYTTVKSNVQSYAPKNGPKMVVKTTAQSNGYSEVYRSNSAPKYAAQYMNKPTGTHQAAPNNNYGEKMAQDAAREYGRLQQEIASKMAEVKRLQSIAEQKMQYQKQQMQNQHPLKLAAPYGAPKMTAEPVKVYDGNNVQISYHKEEENYKY